MLKKSQELLGGTFHPWEEEIEGGVYTDPRKSGAVAVVDGTVDHLCAGFDGEPLEFSAACSFNPEFPEECWLGGDDEQVFAQEADDEPTVRVNGVSLAEYLAEKMSADATAKANRLLCAKKNLFWNRKEVRRIKNDNKRNAGQKCYRPQVEQRQSLKKITQQPRTEQRQPKGDSFPLVMF